MSKVPGKAGREAGQTAGERAGGLPPDEALCEVGEDTVRGSWLGVQGVRGHGERSAGKCTLLGPTVPWDSTLAWDEAEPSTSLQTGGWKVDGEEGQVCGGGGREQESPWKVPLQTRSRGTSGPRAQRWSGIFERFTISALYTMMWKCQVLNLRAKPNIPPFLWKSLVYLVASISDIQTHTGMANIKGSDLMRLISFLVRFTIKQKMKRERACENTDN